MINYGTKSAALKRNWVAFCLEICSSGGLCSDIIDLHNVICILAFLIILRSNVSLSSSLADFVNGSAYAHNRTRPPTI